VDFYGEKTSSRSRCVVGPECETRLRLAVPPSPYPLNGLLGAGLAKSARKILRGEGLGVKI
jgi:hypothetical protein